MRSSWILLYFFTGTSSCIWKQILFWSASNAERHKFRTLDDSEQDDDDEEKEGDVKEDAVDFVRVSGRRIDLVSYAATCPDADVQVEHVALQKGTNINRKVQMQLSSGSSYGLYPSQPIQPDTIYPARLRKMMMQACVSGSGRGGNNLFPKRAQSCILDGGS